MPAKPIRQRFSDEIISTLLEIKWWDWSEEKIKKELHYLLEAEKSLKDCLNENNAHKYYLLTVEFGIKTYRTYLEWCKEAKDFLLDNE